MNPSLPRGVQAFLFDAAERRRRAEETVVRTLQAGGFREILLPVLDYAAPYRGVTAEGDERVYRFLDRQGELLALRADFTPMAARVMAPRLSRDQAVSLFYRGDVVRDEEPGVGRPREFAQVGAETYGEPSFSADERILELVLAALVEIPAAALRLTLGYAGLLEKLVTAVAPSLARGKGAPLAMVLLAARERRVTEVERLLLDGGSSGPEAASISRALLAGFDPSSPHFALPILQAGAFELRRAVEAARAARPGLSVVVDLAGTPSAPYYTGITFGLDAVGVAAPLATGGRYDRLLARFGHPAPATGFSIGVEALAAAFETMERGEEGVARARSTSRSGEPLRIAVGKGRLLGRTLDVLRAGGADFPEPDGRRLLIPDRSGAFELLLLKDDDVPTYVAHGGADLGIVGSDRVAESGEEVFTPLELPFGLCRVSLIGRQGETLPSDGRPLAVGTKYRRLASRFFDERRIPHELIPLAGSVELAAALRLADVVVDLIETGSTIAAHGLVEIETLMTSRATLIVGRAALVARREEVSSLVERLLARQEAPC